VAVFRDQEISQSCWWRMSRITHSFAYTRVFNTDRRTAWKTQLCYPVNLWFGVPCSASFSRQRSHALIVIQL
jgi:hypothetical protein